MEEYHSDQAQTLSTVSGLIGRLLAAIRAFRRAPETFVETIEKIACANKNATTNLYELVWGRRDSALFLQRAVALFAGQ
jgi:hypothetical protein